MLQHPIRVRGAAFACHPDGVLFRRIASPEGKDLGLALACHPERMRGKDLGLGLSSLRGKPRSFGHESRPQDDRTDVVLSEAIAQHPEPSEGRTSVLSS